MNDTLVCLMSISLSELLGIKRYKISIILQKKVTKGKV